MPAVKVTAVAPVFTIAHTEIMYVVPALRVMLCVVWLADKSKALDVEDVVHCRD
jgi:hypothetical protein